MNEFITFYDHKTDLSKKEVTIKGEIYLMVDGTPKPGDFVYLNNPHPHSSIKDEVVKCETVEKDGKITFFVYAKGKDGLGWHSARYSPEKYKRLVKLEYKLKEEAIAKEKEENAKLKKVKQAEKLFNLRWEVTTDRRYKLYWGNNVLCIIQELYNGITIWSKPLKGFGINVRARKTDTLDTIKERVNIELKENLSLLLSQL